MLEWGVGWEWAPGNGGEHECFGGSFSASMPHLACRRTPLKSLMMSYLHGALRQTPAAGEPDACCGRHLLLRLLLSPASAEHLLLLLLTPAASATVTCCCLQAVVWFYLTWIDPRVKGQIAENAAKLANETLNYKCDSPCQSNQKSLGGGCCDGEENEKMGVGGEGTRPAGLHQGASMPPLPDYPC